MTKLLTHTTALLFVLAGCGAADTADESFDPQHEEVEDATNSAEGADQKDGDAPEPGSAESAAEEQPSGDERAQRSEVVLHAHVPRLPE